MSYRCPKGHPLKEWSPTKAGSRRFWCQTCYMRYTLKQVYLIPEGMEIYTDFTIIASHKVKK